MTLAAALLSLAGCELTSEPNLETVRGDLTGFVALYDENGELEEGSSGVLVSIETADGTVEALSDVHGMFRVEDVPAGNYEVLYTKAGYGPYVRYVTHVGGENPTFMFKIWMAKKPDFNITSMVVTDLPNQIGFPYIDVSFIPHDGKARFRFFLSDKPDVSPTNYISTFSIGVSGSPNSSLRVFPHAYLNQFSHAFIQAGDPVYVVAYTENFGGYTSYIDSETGLNVFPALSSNSTPVDAFFLPL